jgi:hypothetical protein
MHRGKQYEVFIRDRLGTTAAIAFNLRVDKPELVDDAGWQIGFDAVTFDALIALCGLAPKVKHSKKQLELFA